MRFHFFPNNYQVVQEPFFLILTQRHVCLFFNWFEKQREILMWERNIHLLPPVGTQTRDWTWNLGMCPHWNQTCNLLMYKRTLQPTEQPVQSKSHFLKTSLCPLNILGHMSKINWQYLCWYISGLYSDVLFVGTSHCTTLFEAHNKLWIQRV